MFHVSLLKLHVGKAPLRRAPIFIPATTSNEFEVEAIVAKRVKKNLVEYLVHWKGYSSFDDTWEPIANLCNAPDIVAAFEKSGVHTRRSSAV